MGNCTVAALVCWWSSRGVACHLCVHRQTVHTRDAIINALTHITHIRMKTHTQSTISITQAQHQWPFPHVLPCAHTGQSQQPFTRSECVVGEHVGMPHWPLLWVGAAFIFTVDNFLDASLDKQLGTFIAREQGHIDTLWDG